MKTNVLIEDERSPPRVARPRDPDTTTQPPPQDHQLIPKRRVLGFKPQPRLERRGEDGQRETEKPDHPASLGDFVTSSTRTKFSVHTPSKDTVTIESGNATGKKSPPGFFLLVLRFRRRSDFQVVDAALRP